MLLRETNPPNFATRRLALCQTNIVWGLESGNRRPLSDRSGGRPSRQETNENENTLDPPGSHGIGYGMHSASGITSLVKFA